MYMSEEINDIEQQPMTANEPVAVYPTNYNGTSGIVHDEIDDLDWSHYPHLGAKTAEEAIARIEKAWEDRNDPTKWTTSEQMWNRLYTQYPWLR